MCGACGPATPTTEPRANHLAGRRRISGVSLAALEAETPAEVKFSTYGLPVIRSK